MSTVAALVEGIAEDKQEWLDSIDYIRHSFGEQGVREIVRAVHDHILSLNIPLQEAALNTPTSIPSRRVSRRPTPATLNWKSELRI